MTMVKVSGPRKCGAANVSARITRLSKTLAQTAAVIAVGSVITSCSALKNYNDYDAKAANRSDYDSLEGRHAPPPQQRGEEPPIPNFQSVVAAPTAPELADTRRVSIAVTETTPVRDILIELARKAQVDLEMDPRISGGIIMTATDRPFIEVVQRIADLAELRYKFERNTLRVELDDPYIEQYRMDVLNISRTATSSASSSTDATSVAQAVGAGGGGGGGSNKSATSIESQTRSDFWNTIGTNLTQILNGIQSRRGGAASSGGATFVPEAEKTSAPQPAPTSPAPRQGAGAGGMAPAGAAGGGGPGAALAAQASNLTAGRQAALDASIQQDQRQADAESGGPTVRSEGAAGGQAVTQSQFSLNPSAGNNSDRYAEGHCRHQRHSGKAQPIG